MTSMSKYERWCQIALGGVLGGAIMVNLWVLLSALGILIQPGRLLTAEGLMMALPALTYFAMAGLSGVRRTASRRLRVSIWSLSILFWGAWSAVLLVGGWPLFPVVTVHLAGLMVSVLALTFALHNPIQATA